MLFSFKSAKNVQIRSSLLLICSVFLMVALVESKVLNCRPLPQCCRKFVFSPACRGVAAKRNLASTQKGNDDILRDPRFAYMETDYGSESDYRNLVSSLPDEDLRALNLFKNAPDEHFEYN